MAGHQLRLAETGEHRSGLGALVARQQRGRPFELDAALVELSAGPQVAAEPLVAPRRAERRRPDLERGARQLHRSLVADRGRGDLGGLPQAVASAGRRGALADRVPAARTRARDDRTRHPARRSRPRRRRRARPRTRPRCRRNGRGGRRARRPGRRGATHRRAVAAASRRFGGAGAVVAAGAGRRRRPRRAAGAGTGTRRCSSTTSNRASITVRTAASTSLSDSATIAARSSWLVSRPIVATAPNTWRASSSRPAISDGDQIGQHHRNRLAGQVRGDELPREERVSLTACDHLVDERVRRRLCRSAPRLARRPRRDPALPGGSDGPPGAGSAPPVGAAVTGGRRPRWRGRCRRAPLVRR